MVITVTDNRTLVDEADSVTGWSSPVGGNAPASFTADPAPKETTAHNGVKVSNAESEILFTLGSSVNLSAGVLVYVWVLGQGIMQTTVNYGIAGLIGDGTNTNAYQIAGADNAVFRHSSGSSVGYMCMLLDTTLLPSGKALRGTLGNLTLTALTEFGADFVTTVKSVGGVENCYIDVIRYGNGGLTIVGTDSASYWMDDLSVLDASSTNSQSYGICRKLGAGSYSFQGQILLGDTGTGADTLRVIDQTFAFEDRSVGTDKFGLTIQGNTTSAQAITFTNSNFLVPTGVGAFFTATDINIENLDVTGCLFTNWDQGFNLSVDATNAPNWDWSNNKFVGCSQINLGKTVFKDNTIENTIDANGSIIIDTNTSLTNVSGLNFISDGTGHAIYITAIGTYSIINFTYTGYGANDTTDAIVYNNSGGLVTLNPTGGDGITVRNGTSASTIINNTQVVTINVTDTVGTVIQNARVIVEADTGGALPTKDSVTITASTTTASVSHTAHNMSNNDWVIIRGTANSQLYNGMFQISNVTTNAYDYTMTGSPPSPATGTITSSFRIMQKLTDINGVASENFNYTADQPITGLVKKSTTSPLYQRGIIIGTIINTGFTTSITMVSDE